MDGGRLFSKVHCDRTRGSRHKLQHGRFPLDMRISFFYHKGRKILVGSLSLEMFKAQPDTPKQAAAAMSLVLLERGCSGTSSGPSQPKLIFWSLLLGPTLCSDGSLCPASCCETILLDFSLPDCIGLCF